MFRLRASFVTLAAALATALPAAAQSSRADQLLSDRPPPRRGCEIARDPHTLPTVAQLADSAALAGAVAAYAARYPISGGQSMFALFSITYGDHGVVERVRPIDYLLPSQHEAELTAVVRQALAQQRGAFTLRLRVEPGGQRVLRVGRSERCPPASNTSFSLVSPVADPREVVQQITVRALIGPDGFARGIQLLRGTGNNQLDRWVQESLARRRYQPGLIDGQPVEMEHEESIRIRSRE